MTTSTPVVTLRDVRKQFHGAEGPVYAVDGINLEIGQGEIVALLGPNGAGKTTTIDMILGLTQATSGEVLIKGNAPRKAIEAGQVSAVLQTGGLLRDLTVRETLQAIASLQTVPDRVESVARTTGLEPLLSRKVAKCSGGEQQRLKFALALLCNPELLILDEPTAGMDVNARREFWATMREDAASGRTIIFATHYLEEAETFAQRTVLVDRGKIIADGSTAEIRAIAAGREVSATIKTHPIAQVVHAVQDLPETVRAEANGERIIAVSKDSDSLALLLLSTYGAVDLEISAPSLENAFVNLTDHSHGDKQENGEAR